MDNMINKINPHRGQELDEHLKEEGIYERVHALARKKIAAFKATQSRTRKLLAARKKAKKSKLSKVTSAISKFVRKRSSSSKKRQPAAKYAKSSSSRPIKKA